MVPPHFELWVLSLRFLVMFFHPVSLFSLNSNISDPLTARNQACIRFYKIIIERKTTWGGAQTDNLPALGYNLDPHSLQPKIGVICNSISE